MDALRWQMTTMCKAKQLERHWVLGCQTRSLAVAHAAPVRPVHVDVTQQNDEDRVGLDSATASSSGLSADLGGGGLSREQPCSGSGTPTKIHPDPAAASATT